MWTIKLKKKIDLTTFLFKIIAPLELLYLLISFGYTGILRVVMSPTELKMQPAIHLHCKPGYSALLCKCIVGCIFNSVWLIITREVPVYREEI
jgi:hypothetical protein